MIWNRFFLTVSTVALLLPAVVTASPNGVTGKTLKTIKTGCDCHGKSATPSVNVSISGPDNVAHGKSETYTLTISGGPAIKAGCNIATRFGTLAAISTTLKVSNRELTHRSAITVSGGSLSLQFTYTAPTTGTVDTIFANGNSVDGNGNENGDSWNWAPSKIITISSATTGTDNTNVKLAPFSLDVNSPNPFRATTDFRFTVGSTTFTTLKVYSLQGTEVATVYSDLAREGSHTVRWNAGSLPAGVYLYRLQAGLFTQTKKLVIAR